MTIEVYPMATPSPSPSRLFDWPRASVLAVVVVLAKVGAGWWIAEGFPTTNRQRGRAANAVNPTPGADILDEDMSRAVRRAALEAGLNPTVLPEMNELWAKTLMESSAARSIDVTDREAVEEALMQQVTTMSESGLGGRGDRGGGGGGSGSGSGGGGGGGVGSGAGDLGQGGQSGGEGSTKHLTPSVERLVEMQTLRLGKAAKAKGIEVERLMPDEALVEAALASDDATSPATRALMEAFRVSFTQLEGEVGTAP